ncbi:hypothetical protein ACJRO7_009488 [Eucalyptus globulus]|uniref:Uncharacterized protein n=1 Tax=Eucalyptus globulus TaxID=34317 RepID=A0ABD3LDW9_EUCGL
MAISLPASSIPLLNGENPASSVVAAPFLSPLRLRLPASSRGFGWGGRMILVNSKPRTSATFIIFKDGKPFDRFGALTADQLIQRIEDSLKVKQ